MKPEQIETLSFKIIDEEAGPHPFNDDQWSIVRRMIHTSADFEYIPMDCDGCFQISKFTQKANP